VKEEPNKPRAELKPTATGKALITSPYVQTGSPIVDVVVVVVELVGTALDKFAMATADSGWS